MNEQESLAKEIRIAMRQPLALAELYTKGVWRSFWRRQGEMPPGQTMPRFQVEMKDFVPAPARVAAFREVCQTRESPERLPAAFLETLFIPLLGKLFICPEFPLSPLGMIHIGQTIEHLRPVETGQPVDLSCVLANAAATERGIELRCDLAVFREGVLCWRGAAEFLSRNTRAHGGKKPPRPPDEAQPSEPPVIIDVPEDTGRRYAAASGDYNPHHLYRLTAKMVGYQRPIAHGMWTLSRTLAEMQARQLAPPFFKLEGRFKRPIFMPARIAIAFGKVAAEGGEAISYGVRDEKTGLPHLAGRITALGDERA